MYLKGIEIILIGHLNASSLLCLHGTLLRTSLKAYCYTYYNAKFDFYMVVITSANVRNLANCYIHGVEQGQL